MCMPLDPASQLLETTVDLTASHTKGNGVDMVSLGASLCTGEAMEIPKRTGSKLMVCLNTGTVRLKESGFKEIPDQP